MVSLVWHLWCEHIMKTMVHKFLYSPMSHLCSPPHHICRQNIPMPRTINNKIPSTVPIHFNHPGHLRTPLICQRLVPNRWACTTLPLWMPHRHTSPFLHSLSSPPSHSKTHSLCATLPARNPCYPSQSTFQVLKGLATTLCKANQPLVGDYASDNWQSSDW